MTVLEAMESGLHLGGAVLRVIGIDDFDADLSINQFRDNNYAALSEIIPPGGQAASKSSGGGHS